MTLFSVLLPYILLFAAVLTFWFLIILIGLLAGTLRIALFHQAHPQGERVGTSRVFGLNRNQMDRFLWALGSLVAVGVYILIFGITANIWMRATPTENWGDRIEEADTVIIFGFGYSKDEYGNIEAGEANEFLLDWVIENTKASVFLVQEGVWVASNTCKNEPICDSQCMLSSGKEMRRMHLHDEKNYVNTLDAVFCTMIQIEQLYEEGKINEKIVVVSHDLQLQRAAWALARVQETQERWQKFEFIIPKIPNTPYPMDSSHWHTRNELIYQVVELFWSRARDFFTSPPIECIAPCFQSLGIK